MNKHWQKRESVSESSFCFTKTTRQALNVWLHLLLIGLLIIVFLMTGTEPVTAQKPSTNHLTARMLAALNALVGSGLSNLAWSPRGAMLAYVGPQDGHDVL